jgi:hypothetical protein
VNPRGEWNVVSKPLFDSYPPRGAIFLTAFSVTD